VLSFGVSVALVGFGVVGIGTRPGFATLPAECSQAGATVTCTYTAGSNAFTVPGGVSTLHVVAIGGMGGNGFACPPAICSAVSGAAGPGGLGAKVSADIVVTPGSTLYAVVGGNAGPNNGGTAPGGFNGGGDGPEFNGAGGGASDVRGVASNLSTRIVVAGGGGGGGAAGETLSAGPTPPDGGHGGNADAPGIGGGTFDNGTDSASGGGGAGAGTASGGGGAGTPGAGPTNGCDTSTPGALANGGHGALTGTGCSRGGGGGGGGVYGGGGGGAPAGVSGPNGGDSGGGGGGGGSSLVPAGGAITTDISGVPEVVISYTVADTVSPASIAFGDTPLGATSTVQAVKLSNSGGAGINVSSVAVAGTNPGDFVISADSCSGQAVAPGSSCTAQVAFKPTATGPRSATVVLTDDAGDSPQTVAVTGNGTTSADLAVAISGPLSVKPQSTASYSVAVTNTGPSTANNVVVNVAVPSGTQFVGVNTTTGSCTVPKKNATSGTITCSLGNLGSGQNSLTVETLKIVLNSKGANVVLAGNAGSTASGSIAATSDPNLGNNTASITTTVTK
jgi:uncharacterized repeat protein (TIGR01451 family)